MNKKHWFAVGTIVIVLAAGSSGYYWWTGTPHYALSQIGKAYTTHDTELAFKYIDFDAVFDSFWSDVQKKLAEQASQSENEWEALGTMMGQGMVENMKPSFRDRLRTEFVDGVRGSVPPEENNILKLTKTFTIHREGKLVVVQGDGPMKFYLERRGEHYWQVVAMKGLEPDTAITEQ